MLDGRALQKWAASVSGLTCRAKAHRVTIEVEFNLSLDPCREPPALQELSATSIIFSRGWRTGMYTSFFGLNEKPFAITPDPRYLFLSERHAEALAHLLYGINEAGGFIQLTGEVGTGKTTVVRSLLAQLPKHADVALILNPRMTPAEFLLAICEELGIVACRDSDEAASRTWSTC